MSGITLWHIPSFTISQCGHIECRPRTAMSGKFNPFHSKQTEVLRIRTVTTRNKALKVLEKLQRKKPCVWAEIQGLILAPNKH